MTISILHLIGMTLCALAIGVLIGGQHSEWVRGFFE